MKQILFFVLIFNILFYYVLGECMLTQSSPVNVSKSIYYYIIILILQPFPNLKKCYKHNEAACCNIINDGYISEYIESFIPEDCLRIFPELEDLLCLGCSANEEKYRDDDAKTIKVCKNFAKKIWKADLDKESTRFDGCGLLADEENSFSDHAEDGYIIPSKEFSNFEDFINTMKIPYYDDYNVILVDGDKNTCFDKSLFLQLNLLEYIIWILLVFIFFN